MKHVLKTLALVFLLDFKNSNCPKVSVGLSVCSFVALCLSLGSLQASHMLKRNS